MHTLTVEGSAAPAALWARVAEDSARWARGAGLPLRDVVLLLPFVQLIDPARRAFAARGGWQPRVETTATLAAALAPPRVAGPGELSGAPVLDALVVAQMLVRQPLFAAWQRRDPRGFAQVVQGSVDTAHDIHHASAAQPPSTRAAWWDEADRQLGPAAGPGALEAALCRIAFEWARLAPAPATDVLFGHRPAAWVVVQAGGVDAVAAALAAHAACPALHIDTDAPVADPFGPSAAGAPPRSVVADGLEAEAQATAAEVIHALNAGHAPVALITLDRVLTRRVRALLERQTLTLVDETGWRLSTTRAAARVMALLRAARPDAPADDRLEWLKGGDSAFGQTAALQRLESIWRSGRPADAAKQPAAAALWALAQAQLAPLATPGRQALAQWLQGLAGVLEATGLTAVLRADAAGAQVLAALCLAPELWADAAWSPALRGMNTDLAGFTDWVDRTLDAANYLPPAAAGAEVVLTPLARALLRPFGAVVIAGADERHLGAPAAPSGWLPEAAARALGLPTPAEHLQREQLVLAQLLRVPRLCFVRRRLEGAEPVAASPAIDAIALARQRVGSAPLVDEPPLALARTVNAAPVQRPAPAAAGALPARLSASAVESLRTCPYQFYARSVLGLREAEELDDTLDKRDYGTWLHAVLYRFHRDRAEGQDDARALLAAADAVSFEDRIDAARLLPYRAGFEQLVPAYVEWLRARDAKGLRWADGERDVERTPPELDGVTLLGRIDRIDAGAGGSAELIDYKTSGVQRLKNQVRDPFEDTQLAFYALLMNADAEEAPPLSAMYLALDTADAPVPVPHKNVAQTAQALLQGLAGDLRRLRRGAGLAALGEGAACDYCAARGLCRRDHWSSVEEPAE